MLSVTSLLLFFLLLTHTSLSALCHISPLLFSPPQLSPVHFFLPHNVSQAHRWRQMSAASLTGLSPPQTALSLFLVTSVSHSANRPAKPATLSFYHFVGAPQSEPMQSFSASSYHGRGWRSRHSLRHPAAVRPVRIFKCCRKSRS